MSKLLTNPMLVGVTVAAGVIIATALTVYFAGNSVGQTDSQPSITRQSIEIKAVKQNYHVGEHLNFTIDTRGICASPNVSIVRNDETNGEAIVIFEYSGGPVHCPPPSQPGEPYFIWNAERLVKRTSDEIYGGEGNSIITRSAAILLKKVGNYTVTASLIDLSDVVSKEFSVTEDNNGEAIISMPARLELISLKAYTTSQEIIGDVVPDMEFKKGEPVLFNATFSNTSPATDMRTVTDIVLMLGIKERSEIAKPDEFSIVNGATVVIPAGGSVSVEQSWTPERAGNYTVIVFSLRKIDMNSTIVMSPVAAIPIKVVE